MRLLIAYDGSSGADAAIADLGRAGLPSDCEALVVSVAEVWLPTPVPDQPRPEHEPVAVRRAREHAGRLIADSLAMARGAAERISALFPGWDVSAVASAESPAWGILQRSDEWFPDLIIIGSHGRSTLVRLLLGSVSQKVLTEARCSVRVARAHSFAPGSPQRIVIGVDGSIDSHAAVRAVARRTWPSGTSVRVVAALDPVYSMLAPSHAEAIGEDGEEDSEEDWIEAMMRRSVDELSAAGLIVTPVIRGTDPKQVLIEEANEWGADAIFVGARGIGPLERFLLGSVSAAIAARAHCSVEVVRP